MKKLGILMGIIAVFAVTVHAFAKSPGAAVKNENANPNACWGMDRAFYASEGFFPKNMDIKQSFPGDVGEQRAAWVATYCDPHGPVEPTPTPTPSPTATPTPTPTPILVDTVVVDSSNPSGASSSIPLTSGKQYRFDVSGTWTNDGLNVADAEFASTDAWVTPMDGYNISPYFLGAGEFDLQVNNAFVDWGVFSATHEYTNTYPGAGAPVNFSVFDGDSNGPTQEPSWYSDNSGSLTVKIYELP